MQLVQPDYSNSILNIISSFMKHYDLETNYNSLESLKSALESEPKNIVLIVMDGMGDDALNYHLDDDAFLIKNKVQTLTSVYPCTTTAAMNAYYSGLSPLEHGWVGWSLYFKEYNRTVDAFLNRDSYSKDIVGEQNAARTILEFETIYDKINSKKGLDVQTYTVNPEGIVVAKSPNINYPCENLKDFSNSIITAMYEKGNKYIHAYWYEPDLVMHKTGCYSQNTAETLRGINRRLAHVADQAPEDTLIVICADHGLTDIKETLYLNNYPQIMDCLIMPPFIEPRCLSFYVKDNCHKQFESLFNDAFGDDFRLMTGTEFIEAGWLGNGTPHKKIDDFIGNYMAVGTGQKLLKYRTVNITGEHDFAAHHAGLRPEEMLVPLIVYSK